MSKRKDNLKIVQISKGPEYTHALCEDGSVWVGVEGVWYPYGGEFPETKAEAPK